MGISGQGGEFRIFRKKSLYRLVFDRSSKIVGKVDHLVYPQGLSAVSLHFSYLAIVAIPRKLPVAGGSLTLENFETVGSKVR